MKKLKLLACVLSLALAALLLWAGPSSSQGFVDRIVRPCSSGAVTQANVIVNPNSSGNVNVTPCTGGSLTVNGVPVVAGGLPDPGSNGFIVRTAAGVAAARTLGGSNGITIGNGTGVAGNPDIAGVNAVADGATKGVSAYNANDFNAATGIITLDYTNGQAASAVLKGYLTSADWTVFNAKQPAGNYITALTGDGTATGPGSVAFTLASVISAGSCTACNLTYDAKGRITIAGNGSAGITNSAGAGVFGLSDGTNIVAGRITQDVADVNEININPIDTNGSVYVNNGALTASIRLRAFNDSIVDLQDNIVWLGDVDGNVNNTNLKVDDDLKTITLNSGAGTTTIGDTATAGNGTTIIVNDSAPEINLTASGKMLVFTGDVLSPNSVTALGSSGAPFSSAFVGNAANNSSQITGTFTDNRVATLPDITGTIVLNTAATVDKLSTTTNCADSAGAAACGSASAGSFVVDASATSTVVSTTAVTANSQIFVFFDASLGARLGITCNATVPTVYGVTVRTAGTSFTLGATAPAVNPACFNYLIVN